jgi:hypothetical protein
MANIAWKFFWNSKLTNIFLYLSQDHRLFPECFFVCIIKYGAQLLTFPDYLS